MGGCWPAPDTQPGDLVAVAAPQRAVDVGFGSSPGPDVSTTPSWAPASIPAWAGGAESAHGVQIEGWWGPFPFPFPGVRGEGGLEYGACEGLGWGRGCPTVGNNRGAASWPGVREEKEGSPHPTSSTLGMWQQLREIFVGVSLMGGGLLQPSLIPSDWEGGSPSPEISALKSWVSLLLLEIGTPHPRDWVGPPISLLGSRGWSPRGPGISQSHSFLLCPCTQSISPEHGRESSPTWLAGSESRSGPWAGDTGQRSFSATFPEILACPSYPFSPKRELALT